MFRLIGLFVCFLSLSLMAQDEILLFRNLTLIDGTGAPASPGTNILVGGDTIVAIGRHIPIPENATIIDASGKFMIPGLWDMHVHWMAPEFLPLFVANGVTGVRQMMGFSMFLDWRKKQAEGTLLSPHLYIASPIVDGPRPVWPGSVAVATPDQGRKVARDLAKGGADFIKVYSLLPTDVYLALAEEARGLGFPFAGHVPLGLSITQAMKAGQASIEHLTGILAGTSDLEAAYLEEMNRLLAEEDGGKKALSRAIEMELELKRSYNPEKARALFVEMARDRMYQCPTLVVLRNLATLDQTPYADDPNLAYIPKIIKQGWDPQKNVRLKNRTPQDWENAREVYKHQKMLVHEMYKRKIPILAGTDVLNPYCLPGFSLHDELALLVEAGIHPLGAIRAATADAARFMGVFEKQGSIHIGKLADLVLLDADPLVDIANTKKIHAVMQGGKLYDRAALDAMLAEVKRKAE